MLVIHDEKLMCIIWKQEQRQELRLGAWGGSSAARYRGSGGYIPVCVGGLGECHPSGRRCSGPVDHFGWSY